MSGASMGDFGLSSTIDAWSNALIDYYGTKYDKQENELAYERAIQNRDYMNAYNSPAQQMARLKQAGLNPRLMYGQGNTGNQPSLPSGYNPTKMRSTPKNIQVSPFDALNMKRQMADINYVDEMTRKQRLSNELFEDTMQNKKQGIISENFSKLYDAEFKQMKNNVLHENYEEIKRLTYQAMKNQWSIQQFEANLARREMTKSDTLWARKAFEWADKLGLQKRLEEAFINESKKWYK